jgi:predicted metal-dependent peptidase
MNTPIAIDRARYWGLTNPHVVFYGALASNLADVMDPTVQTACTDGKVIRWNPEFVAKLTDEEVRFVLLHEALHCAHGHFWRLPINDDGNKAGDYAINATLDGVVGIKMPKGGLIDKKRFANMAEEEILAALKAEPQGGGGGNPNPDGDSNEAGKDAGGCGGFQAPAPTTPPPAKLDASGKPAKPAPQGQGQAPTQPDLKEQWERNVVAADMAQKATGRGTTPADMARLLAKLLAPAPLDWRQEMADFVRSALSSRNDWTRGNRRMAQGHGKPLYPRRKANDVGLVVFVRDTSGSVSDQLVAEFNQHIAQSMAEVHCRALVIDCDAQVHAEHLLDAHDEVPAKAQGGGGTDFRPAFERIAEHVEAGDSIAGVVYLTDLEGTEPDEVAHPTLWLSTTANVARTGRTVRIETGA